MFLFSQGFFYSTNMRNMHIPHGEILPEGNPDWQENAHQTKLPRNPENLLWHQLTTRHPANGPLKIAIMHQFLAHVLHQPDIFQICESLFQIKFLLNFLKNLFHLFLVIEIWLGLVICPKNNNQDPDQLAFNLRSKIT